MTLAIRGRLSFRTARAQGGLCISIAETFCAAIDDKGIIVPERAQWIIMGVSNARVGLNAPAHQEDAISFGQVGDSSLIVEH